MYKRFYNYINIIKNHNLTRELSGEGKKGQHKLHNP